MASNMYHCVSCEFSSEKQSNYIKHLATLKHKALIELTQFSEAGEAGTSSSTSENAARSDEKQVFTEDFFPFSNRLELLLYVLRGSKYHCIDQELFKFILLIIIVVVEDNIKTVPPFHKIWNLKVDGLELKQSVSSNNGKDVSFIKPSDIIEMQLSKKLTAVQLQRFPRCGHVFEGQSSGSKWRTEIKSLMALNSVSERIYVGDRVKNGINGESGSIIHFFCQEFEDTEKIYASVKCDSTRTITVRADGLMKLDESNVYEGNDFERVKNLVQMSKQLDMDIYTVPVNIFVDDTSGNRSKKWNPLQVWTLQLAGLPTDEKMKKSTHHFIGVTQPEDDSFITSVVDDLNHLFYDGKVMYDAAKNKDVIVTSQIAVGLMDNSMASEFCHHMGAAAKENCRFCRFGNNHLNIRDTRTKEKTEDILKEIETSINGKETSTRYGIKKKAIAEEMNKAACWDPHSVLPITIVQYTNKAKCRIGNSVHVEVGWIESSKETSINYTFARIRNNPGTSFK
ncbi:uncharacterized protein LOC134717559 [Mytilus trossulus]|uniref:uncharacterized protein LOC134717559 n=1 Tax=Mytilus trossulus TaxID=6551 RepID=UPI0030050543